MKRDGKVLWERALGWSHDLPKVDEVPKWRSVWTSVKPAPNYFDHVYLELPRSSTILRGVIFLIGVPGLLFALGLTLYLYWSLLHGSWPRDWLTNISIALLPVALWALTAYVRLDLVAPRDEPIRFNRLRQKIYIYEFKYDRIFIFSRKRWGVKPVAYNWDDVTAEVYRVYAPGHGGLIENVMLSIRNPEMGVSLQRHRDAQDERLGLEKSEGARGKALAGATLAAGTPWVRFDQGSRLEAHFRQAPESSWCNRGRSEVASWPQERQRDQSLFWRGAGTVDRGGKQSFSDGLAWAGADDFEEEAGVKPEKSRKSHAKEKGHPLRKWPKSLGLLVGTE